MHERHSMAAGLLRAPFSFYLKRLNRKRMLWCPCEMDRKWYFSAYSLGKRLHQTLHFKRRWLLNLLFFFVIMENRLNWICRRAYIYFFLQNTKAQVLCYVVTNIWFTGFWFFDVLGKRKLLSIQSWKHCDNLSGNQCQLSPNVFFLFQFSNYVVFLYSYRRKRSEILFLI